MNITLHLFPCLLTVWKPPELVLFWHGVLAACIHVGWGLLVSDGSLKLNKLYIAMDPSFWNSMWLSAVVGEVLLAPFMIYPLIVERA